MQPEKDQELRLEKPIARDESHIGQRARVSRNNQKKQPQTPKHQRIRENRWPKTGTKIWKKTNRKPGLNESCKNLKPR